MPLFSGLDLAVGLEGFLKHFQGACQVLSLENVRHPHLIGSQFLVGIESGSRRHHHGFPDEFRLLFFGTRNEASETYSAIFFRFFPVLLPAEIRQAPSAEILCVLHRQACHRVEGAFWKRRVNPGYLVEAFDEEVASGLVFIETFLGIELGPFDGCLRGNLSEEWRAEP